MNRCFIGDCRDGMREVIAQGVRVQTAVTSPPYWGLRDYGTDPLVWGGDAACAHEWHGAGRIHKGGGAPAGELAMRSVAIAQAQTQDRTAGSYCECGAWRGSLGLEPTIAEYISNMVGVFRLVRELLADDGTLWLNIGDSYATGAGSVGGCPGGGEQGARWNGHGNGRMLVNGRGEPQTGPTKNAITSVGPMTQPNRMPQPGLKPKDLCMIPARLALALQADGWWLRQDIIWHKPNPMPESVTDRCTKAHEYIFLLTKSERYYYDAKAISEECSDLTNPRRASNGWKTPDGWDTSRGDGGHGSFHKDGREDGRTDYEHKPRHGSAESRSNEQAKHRPTEAVNGMRKLAAPNSGTKNNASFDAAMAVMPERRNKRSVWTIATEAFPEAHFATFPQALVEPCILAGSRPGDTVFDPFFGSGTVGEVAQRLGRQWLGCELAEHYEPMQRKRVAQSGMVFA